MDGKKLRALREAAGLTQRAVAIKAGFSGPVLCAMEGGFRECSEADAARIIAAIGTLHVARTKTFDRLHEKAKEALEP
jgi:transcriptional regulator with XRE-family HTH domain